MIGIFIYRQTEAVRGRESEPTEETDNIRDEATKKMRSSKRTNLAHEARYQVELQQKLVHPFRV